MSKQTEKLSSPLGVLPEPEHNAFEAIFYKNNHVLGWVLSALNSGTKVIAGEISGGQIQNLIVQFCFEDGSVDVVSFPNTDIGASENRKIYYADYATETILSVELPGFEDFVPDETEFPLVHAIRYQSSPSATTDSLEWIAPRTDKNVPAGLIAYIADGIVPDGWSEYAAARGRMIVGLPPAGTNEGTVGAAFTDQEDRDHCHIVPIEGRGGAILIKDDYYGSTILPSVTNSAFSSLTSTSTEDITATHTSDALTSDVLAYIQLMAIKKL